MKKKQKSKRPPIRPGRKHQDRFARAGAAREERSDLSRVLALSDGVFSIVITLLIFEVKVPTAPDASHHFTQVELLRALGGSVPKLISYVATFLVIGIYWTGHQGVFKHIVHFDRGLLWLNNLFLMCVCFMPFPTALLGSYWDTQVGVVTYGLSLCLTGASLALLWRYATHGHRLVAPSLGADVIALGHKRILMAPLAALISILVSSVNLQLSLAVYALAGIAYLIPSRLDKHTYERHAPGDGITDVG